MKLLNSARQFVETVALYLVGGLCMVLFIVLRFTAECDEDADGQKNGAL